MRILFLVHIESGLSHLFPPGYADRVVEQAMEYDRVIALSSGFEREPFVWQLDGVVDTTWEWCWGYHPDGFSETELAWLIPSRGHEWTWVPPELRCPPWWIRYAEVTIGGGCDGSCLADFRAVLEHVGIKYTEDRSLIY